MHVSTSLPPPPSPLLAFICLLVSNDPDLINNNKQTRTENKNCNNNKFTNDGQQFPLARRRSKSTWQFPAEWQAVSLSFFLSPPSILLIYFYSGRGTWQSCIEWTLNRLLQLNKDRLFVCPSVCMPEEESDTIIDLFTKIVQVSWHVFSCDFEL